MFIKPQDFTKKHGILELLVQKEVSPFTFILKSKNTKIIIKEIQFTSKSDFLQWLPCLKHEIEKQNDQWNQAPDQILKIIEYTYTNSPTSHKFYLAYDCDAMESLNNFSRFTDELKFEITLKILEIGTMIKNTTVCHHNIKPSNLILTKKNQVLLTDYGSTRTHYRNYVKIYNQEADKSWQNNFLFYQCYEYLNIMNNEVEFRDKQWEKQFQNDDIKSDIWALGVIILQLYLNQKVPQHWSSFYGLNKDNLRADLKKLKYEPIRLALDALLLKDVNIQEVYEKLQNQNQHPQNQISQVFQLRQSQKFYQPKYLHVSQTRLKEIEQKENIVEYHFEVKQRLQEAQHQVPDYLEQSPLRQQMSSQNENLIDPQPFQIDVQQIEFDVKEEEQIIEPEFVHQAPFKLLQKSHEVLQLLCGKNYYLHKFLTDIENLSFIHFENLKYLNSQELEEYRQGLNDRYQKRQTNYSQGWPSIRKQNREKEMEAIKFHEQLSQARLNALKMLNGSQQYSETSLLYYLNQQELDQFKPDQREVDRFDKKIQEIKILNKNIDHPDKCQLNGLNLKNVELERLENLKLSLENSNSRGIDRIKQLFIIEDLKLIIQKIQEERRHNFFQKFPFTSELEKEQMCRIKCQRFLDTKQENYLLKMDEFKTIKEWYLAKLYIKTLFDLNHQSNRFIVVLSQILSTLDKIDSPKFYYLKSRNTLVANFFSQNLQWNEEIPFDLLIYKHKFDGFEEEYKQIDGQSIYKGYEFLGQPHGLGVMIQNDVVYQGIFKQGRFIWGVVYEQIRTRGENLIRKYIGYVTENNLKNGECKFEIYDSQSNLKEKYEGTMKDGEVTGKGKKTYYVNGQETTTYEGEWRNNQKEGCGKMINHLAEHQYDEFRFEGQFRGDKKNGQGVVYLQSNNALKRKGDFEDGKPIGIHTTYYNNEEQEQIRYKYFLCWQFQSQP